MANKWAVVGKGFIFSRHKSSILAVGDELIMTCDNDPEKEADFLNYKDMMKDEAWKDVTHVAICTPNYLHAEIASAMDDKIILCEKPLGISSGVVEKLKDNVFTVLQLRHHPEVLKLEKMDKPPVVSMTIKVKRDKSYWDGWKGKDERSGGILFNIGIHYFDILIHLLGNEYTILNSVYSDKLATGILMFGDTFVKYHVEIMDNDIGQDRSIMWGDYEAVFSKKDNLSFEDLHTRVYEDVKRGVGIGSLGALPSIYLVEKLKKWAHSGK